MELPTIPCDDPEPELPADVELDDILYEMQKIDAKLDKFYIYMTGDCEICCQFIRECVYMNLGVVAKSINMANLLFFCLYCMYDDKKYLLDSHKKNIDSMIENGIRITPRNYAKHCFIFSIYTTKHEMNKLVECKLKCKDFDIGYLDLTLRRMPHHIKLYDYYDIDDMLDNNNYETILDFNGFQRYNDEYIYVDSDRVYLSNYDKVKSKNDHKNKEK